MESQRRRVRRGLIVTVVAVAALGLVVPASGSAATTLGQLRVPPAGVSCDPGRVYFQPVSSAETRYAVPAGGGVITSWAIRPATGAGQQGSLKILRGDGGDQFTVLASSAVQNLTPDDTNTFPVRIPVQGGELIAFSYPTTVPNPPLCQIDGPVAGNATWNGAGPSPSADPGTSFTVAGGDKANGVRLNLQATLEADADRDGFGDESQDRCPATAGTTDGCAASGPLPVKAPDRTKPTFGALSFSRSTFRAARSGAAFSSQKKKGRKKSSAPTGTKVSFNLSEASSVRFTVQRKTSGRRVKGRCKTRTRSNRKKPKCTLYKNVTGSFTVTGKPGKNTFTFRGRIGGKALKAGSYRLNGTATDPAKNASTPKNKTFRVVR